MTPRQLVILLFAAIAAPAHAQLVPRAEHGSVRFRLDGFERVGETVTLRGGDWAWNEALRPADVVRLVDDAVARGPRDKADGVPAGGLLFGYALSTGSAYCAPVSTTRGTGRVQCLRDFDGDGAFDGGYVTTTGYGRNTYFSLFLRSLGSVPKTRYEAADSRGMEPVPLQIRYVGMHKNAPRFSAHMDDRRLSDKMDCRPAEPGVCRLLGLTLAFQEVESRNVEITFIAAEPERVFSLVGANALN